MVKNGRRILHQPMKCFIYLPYKSRTTPVAASPQTRSSRVLCSSMAMSSSLLSLSLCFLVVCHGCLAQIEQQAWQGQQQQQQQQHRRYRDQSECRVESLNAQEPARRTESEAGVTEYWNENSEQFECAGVAASRHIIESRGLLLPSFNNAPKLIYVVQGRGIQGTLIPGCPETFQSFQQFQEGGGQRFRDQHQRVRHFRQGDIIAVPNGVAHWFYNDGESQLVLVTVLDRSNNLNQLDRRARKFNLAGNPQKQQGGSSYRHEQSEEKENEGNNIFAGFPARVLAEAFGVSEETARKLQSENDNRGEIVRVKNGLQVIRPSRREEEEQQQERQERGNGLEETLCNARLRENIGDPSRADTYSPQAGRVSYLNSQKLPILSYLQLSAERGVLYRNALVSPHWNINAHSVIYVTRGNARVQVVGNRGQAVYNGQLREGQILVVPQNFAVVKQAGNDGFEWVAFKTNDNAMTSPLAGKTSVLRGIPEEVLTNAYQISRDDARRLKYNREEILVLSPRSGSQGRASE